MALTPFNGTLDAPSPSGLKPFDGQLDGEEPQGGLIASLKRTTGQTIAGIGQAAGDYLPGVSQDNALKRYGQEVIEANPTAVNSLGDIADKPWTALKEATGNAAASIGSMVGAKALGQGVSAVAPFTGPARPIVAALGKGIEFAGPTIAAALPSYGGIRQAQQQNAPEGEADSLQSKALAAGGAGLVGLIEGRFGPENWALKAMGKEGREQLAKQFAADSLTGGLAKGALKGAATEGAEEIVQNPIEQLSSYQDPTTAANVQDTLFGGAMGALGGGVFGGGAGGLGYYANRNQPQADPSAGPLSRAAATAEASGATANAMQGVGQAQADPFADVLGRLTPADMRAIRAAEGYGPESVQEVLRAASLVRNPEMDPHMRQQAADALRGFWQGFDNRPNWTRPNPQAEQPAQPGTAVAPVGQSQAVADPSRPFFDPNTLDGDATEIAGTLPGAPRQLVGPEKRFLEAPDRIQAKRDADAAYEQAFQDLVKAEQLGASDADLLAYQQALADRQAVRDQLSGQLADTDARVQGALGQQSTDARRSLLDTVLNDPETKNPLPRFESMLKKQGYAQRRATDEERQAIERFKSATDTFSGMDREPSAPNEMDAAAMGIRERQPKVRQPQQAPAEKPQRAAFPMTREGAERRAAEQTQATGQAFEAVPHPTVKGRFAVQASQQAQTTELNATTGAEPAQGVESGRVVSANTSPERVTETPEIEQVAPADQNTIKNESSAVAGVQAEPGEIGAQQPRIEPTNSLSRTASWVLRNKATGEVVMETFDRKKVDALNTDKYEAVPIQEHLASLNRQPTNALLNAGEISSDEQRYQSIKQTPPVQRSTEDVAWANEYRAKQSAPAQREAAEQAEQQRAKQNDTDGFAEAVATGNAMRQAKVRNALNQIARFNGTEQPRKEAVRARVAAGATVEAREGQDALVNPDGSYLLQSLLTKTGIDYARHLIAAKQQGTANEKAPQALPPTQERGTAQQAEVANATPAQNPSDALPAVGNGQVSAGVAAAPEESAPAATTPQGADVQTQPEVTRAAQLEPTATQAGQASRPQGAQEGAQEPGQGVAAKAPKPGLVVAVDAKDATKRLRRYFAATTEDQGPHVTVQEYGKEARIEVLGRSHTNYSKARMDVRLTDGKWEISPLHEAPANEIEREYQDAIRSAVEWLNTTAKSAKAKREAAQERMKKANAALRKGDDAALRAMGFSDERIAQLKKPDFAGRTGFANYELTNNNAEIRRLKQRVEELQSRVERVETEDTPQERTIGPGRIVENVADNRVQVFFDGKPDEAIRNALKAAAFRWAPSAGAWQRQLTPQAVEAAERALKPFASDAQFSRDTPSTGTTPDAIWSAVESLVGPLRRRRIIVVQSADVLVEQGILQSRDAQGAQAFVKDGKAYFIADAIRPGNERAVFLHEVGAHLGMEKILSPLQRSVLLTRIQTWAAQDNGSIESRIAQAALRRVEAAGATGEDAEAELLAYTVEEAVKAGVNPTADAQTAIGQWFRQFMADVRKALEKLGLLSPKALTAQDIVNLAHGAANVAMSEDVQESSDPRIQFSRAAMPDWLNQMPQATQEAARKAGIWQPHKPLKERLKDIRATALKRVQQGLVDQFAPLKELGDREYVLARLTKSSDAPLEALLLYGKPFLNDAGAIDVNLEKGGLIGGLQKLEGEHDRFFAWMAGNRAEQLKAEGRENLFTDTDITALKDLNQGNMPDGSSRAAKYNAAKLQFSAYSKAVLDIAEKAGIIAAEDRAIWEKDFYVPFYRAMEDGDYKGPRNASGLVNQYAFKKLKGGTDNLNDLMQNTLRNWSHLLSASLKNQASAAALESAEAAGVATPISQKQKGSVSFLGRVKHKIPKGQSYVENGVTLVSDGTAEVETIGEKHYMVDDPFILNAITSLEFAGWNNPAMKMMQKAKHYLTLGVTISPTFKIRNLIRDQISAIGLNPMSYNLMSNLAQGWKGTDKDSAQYAKMLAGGGLMRFGTFLEDDRAEHMKRLIQAGVSPDTILDTKDKVKAMLGKAWDWWQDVGDRSENITRASIYQQRYDQFVKEGKTADEAHLLASFAARDSMDFSLQGQWGSIRFLTQLVPFLGARLQGLYKLGREGVAPSVRLLTGNAEMGDKERAMRFGAVTGTVALASIALFLAYRDDDDWKDREEWDRDAYWWFKVGDTAFRIPKPFEIGAIGTIAERGLETALNGMDKESRRIFIARMWEMLMGTFAMNPVPQLFKPVIDLYANTDSFTGRPIETMGMERLSKAQRIGPGTSATAQLLGKATSLVGLSPVQVDHLIEGYFSWLGTHAVMTTDFALRPLMGLPDQPARKWPDGYFVLGDFAKDLPSNQSKYLTQFYEQSKKVQEAMADIRYYQSLGQTEKALELSQDNADKIRMHGLYTTAERQISGINKQIKAVQMSSATADVKREQIDRLTQARNQIAKAIESRRVAQQ